MSKSSRTPAYPVQAFFVNRWSPRSFSGAPLDESTLFSFFEAARWAPSANNSQPWRFVYALNGSARWASFLELLNENNQKWAAKASAIVLLISKTTHVRAGAAQATPLRNHSLDAGAAWLSVAIQADLAGWRSHAIGGFDRERAREVLEVPEGFVLEIAIAIGKQSNADELTEELRAREQPNQRVPLSELVSEGRFAFNS